MEPRALTPEPSRPATDAIATDPSTGPARGRSVSVGVPDGLATAGARADGIRADRGHADGVPAVSRAVALPHVGRSSEEADALKSSLLAEASGLTDAPSLMNLVSVYYRYVPADEIIERHPADLLAAVVSHRELAADRVPGQLKLRVSTPSGKDSRWCGGHSVIEVVTDDMPFLVDSVTAELARHDLGIHLLIHPQVVVRREVLGELKEVRGEFDPDPERAAAAGDIVESWMHVEVDRQTDDEVLDRLRNDLQRVLTDVRDVVEDWERMRNKALTIADELTQGELPVPDKDVTDARELLRWLADEHFTFLGYREYVLRGEPGEQRLEAVLGTGLGILRGESSQQRYLSEMPPEVRAKILEQRLLVITKANSRSTVHRPSYLDYIGFKTFDADGSVTGERRFLGLFASAAYLESVRKLPVISRKVEEVIRASGLSLRSHSGKDLIQVLETYPRDELFQISTRDLFNTAMAVLRLAGRRQLRLFLRKDAYGRFVSCLVYLPRDRYTTANRLRMQEILMEALHGIGVDYTTRVTESVLARVKFIVRIDPTAPVGDIDTEALQTRLANATRSWDDDFAAEIRREIGEDQAAALLRRYGTAFPAAYKAEHDAASAVEDLSRIEMLEESGDLGMSLYRDAYGAVRFTVYQLGDPMALSDVLPVLHSLGVQVVDERPYRVTRADGLVTWVYDFGLRIPAKLAGGTLDVERVHGAMENAFAACWRGECEVDGFNTLVLSAGLTWAQVVILRAYAHYLRQAGTIYSQEYIERALAAHPEISRQLLELFSARFDPGFSGDAEARATDLIEDIRSALDQVASLDEDRILRSFLTLVQATLRTNHYQRGRGGRHKAYLSLKIDPQAVPELPMPRPKYEIFVYSPRMEGVHLRFGAVARGGLRWSDRREDFRTEVLGLVKAQMVKNTVIVPVGSKGGFVVKKPPASTDREAVLAEGIACYKMFISGLLDLTDNLVAGKVVPPDRVLRHDGDDTYLVVAADKGTATFSDIANEVAISYGFWLGDAFASGGSAGYDHKGMAITARGAWESVKHHFRDLGVDTQTEDFTAVGIGDMSGDVFGNGMLLSEHIRLVAAFDHRHVFVDPNPDAASSFVERRRLFELPRSSWGDYDTSLISEGGGVFPRTLKSIPISPQMHEALAIDPSVQAMSPAELVKAVLLAPVDLLWNGGIGTYVKAWDETHAEVGDKANDGVRVNGRELRCKVVGEGGNLGLTQRGRVEFAKSGGHINNDAIDNSAGVDTSDHEVNIKILLDRAVENGELSHPERNALLVEMTDEVADLVLRDNYEQNAALGISRYLSGRLFSVHRRLMAELERTGRLNRALEFLPTDAQCEDWAGSGRGLASPELSVLLAYVKIALEADLNASPLPDDSWCIDLLVDYFPTPLRERYRSYMDTHPLRREIITTSVVNEVVNHAGITFLYRVTEEVGAEVTDAVRAYMIVRDVFGLREIWAAVRVLDNVVPTDAQNVVLAEVRRVIDRGVRWLLQNRSGALDVEGEVAWLRPGMLELLPHVEGMLVGVERDAEHAHVAQLIEAGVPKDLAELSTATLYGFGLVDVVEMARRLRRSPQPVAAVYYAVSERFRMDDLLDRISALARGDRWQALARMALRYDLYAARAGLAEQVLESTPDDLPAVERVNQWVAANAAGITRAVNTLSQVAEDTSRADLATLSVVLRQIRTIVGASSASSR